MKHYQHFQAVLLTIVFFISMLTSTIGQPWLEQLSNGRTDQQPSFFDVQNAFNDYWGPKNVGKDGYYMENGVRTKAYGWKQFKRWEWEMQFKIDPKTGFLPDKSAQQIYDQYVRTLPKSTRSTTSNWSSLGVTGLGRVNCIAFHPTDINTYWIGAPSGGLWVTTNNGASWTCLTDKNAVLGVSDIIIPTDYNTSKTIYIATGDRDGHNNSSVGVLKSTNGGVTWINTGLSFQLSSNRLVTRLLLDPYNNQIIVAATTAGVYKTSDGGTTWSLLTTTSFIDLEFKPGNFNSIYGSTKSGLIYFSSNGGISWTQSLNLLNGRRIEMAVSPAQPTWVYAVVSGIDNGLYGIYKSINNGTSFTQIFAGTTSNLLGRSSDGSVIGGQGWYDLSLAVSPTNANTIILGGIVTWKSINGGSSWIYTNGGAHVDKHMHKYTSGGLLFECNDGGIYMSADNAVTWVNKSSNLSIAQMYKLGISQTSSGEVLTGLQDNGTRSLNNGTWDIATGGDGMECIIDYTNANVQYSSYYNGQLNRTIDKWKSTYKEITPLNAGTGAWVTPYFQDPTNPNTIYAGYSRVWKSTDKGDSWQQISDYMSDYLYTMAISKSNPNIILTSNGRKIWKSTNGGGIWENITKNLPGNWITDIKVHASNPSIIWVSLSYFDGNRIFQSSDGGNSWTNISTGLPELPVYSIVQNTQIASETHLYIGTELGIYFKKGANNWVPFNNNLPNVKIGELEIYYNTSSPDQSKLRAATYGRGLWESNVYYETVTPVVTTPSNVQATDGTFTDKVQVTWSGTSGNYFRVYRNTTNINSTAIALGTWQTSTTYDDLSATAGTIYYYFVRAASNSSGTTMSTFSTGDSGIRSAVTTTPSIVQASDGTYTDKVRITWTGTYGNYFRIYRSSTTSSANSTVISGWQTSQLFDDFSAVAGTTYYYFVQASINSSGSNPSNMSTGDPGNRSTVASTPSNVQASDGAYADRVNITWSGTSGNFFRVIRNTSNSTSAGTVISNWQNTQLFFDDLSAVTGTTYYYFVQAASSSAGAKPSSYSAINSGWRSAAPAVTIPSSVIASDGTYSDKVRVSWAGTSGNYFRVIRNTSNSTSGGAVISNWQNTQLFFDDFSTTAGIIYYYFVQAAGSGAGANASVFSAINSGWRSTVTACSTPTGLKSSQITSSSVILNWNAISGVSQYSVWYIKSNVWTLIGSVTQNSAKISGLSARVGYCFAVRAVCGSSSGSLSGSVCITTAAASLANNTVSAGNDSEEPISVQDNVIQPIRVYPNPALIYSDVTLEFISDRDVTNTIILMNTTGTMILKVEVPVTIGENRIRIPAPSTPGMYICQMLSGKEPLLSKKIVITQD